MVFPIKAAVRIYDGLDTLSRALASSVVERINSTVRTSNMFSFVLSGGSTPRALYRLLGSEFRDRIPWDRVHFFWGDERYVPPDDPRSNYRMVRESLLDHISIPRRNVHPMPTELPTPEESAEAYEAVLKTCFPAPWPCFDLVLLGLGPEGHTASLFPHSPALQEQQRWVIAVAAPAEPPLRLTLTLPALNRAASVYFLATGAEKAAALHQAITSPAAQESSPATMVRPEHGNVIWWADEEAAELLPASFRL